MSLAVAPASSAKPLHRLLALNLILIAFLLRIHRLDQQALRGDEAASVLYAALPVGDLWQLSRLTDPHPPLFYLMLHSWQWLMGESAWAMRFAGVGASLLAVVVLYRLAACTLGSPTLGLLAAGLLVINPLQIWLAQDVRSYPFVTLLGLLSSGVLWWALTDKTNDHGASKRTKIGFARLAPRSLPWLLYVLLTVASLYVHYYTVFLIAFQGTFVLLNAGRFRSKRRAWLTAQVAIILASVPGLMLAYNFAETASGGIEVISLPAILQRTSGALLTGFTLDPNRSLLVSLWLAPLWIAGLVGLARRDRVVGTFWSFFFLIPVVGVIALSINRPFFKERFLAQAMPAFEVVLAVGFYTLSNLLRRWRSGSRSKNGRRERYGATGPATPPIAALRSLRSYTLPTILLLTLLYFNGISLLNYFTNDAYAKAPPWSYFQDYVSSKARAGDVVVTNFPEASVSYYSPNDLPFYVVPAEPGLPREALWAQTEQVAQAYDRIWFLPLLRRDFDEDGEVLAWLDRHADRVDQIFFPDYHLNLYLAPATIEATMIRQPVTFANGLALRGYQILDQKGDSRLTALAGEEGRVLRVAPAETFTLSLYWTANQPLAEPATVFTHLVAADGFNRAGRDNEPVWGTYPTTQWQPSEKVSDKYALTIPAGTPPGDHRIRVGWYHSASQVRVPVVDDAGQPGEESVILAGLIVRVE